MTDPTPPTSLRDAPDGFYPASPAAPAALWGVVEKMGHKVLAGRITEEERFGGRVGRVDVPQADGSFVTHLFTPQSIYGLTYCSEAAARVRAAKLDVAPVGEWDLPQKVRDAIRAAEREVRPALPAADLPPAAGPYPARPAYHGERTDAAGRVGDEDDEPLEDDASDIRF